MSKQRYPEEFKIEAVKQITERGHRGAIQSKADRSSVD
jgi:transposase